MTSWPRAAIALGAAGAFGILLSPALLPGSDVISAAVLPLGFFAAGSVAQVLRAGHPVGERLLAVGVLHLVAIVGAVAVAISPYAGWLSLVTSWVSALMFALGFVALLDLLARFPTGGYAWGQVGWVVRGTAATAVALITLSFLGSRQVPSVLGLEAGANPAYAPALEILGDAFTGIALAPVLGLALLSARYPRASPLDRSQMRWPLITAVVVAAGIATTGLAEGVLGAQVQAAVFITAAAALPASFLIGLLRHTEQADRLAAVEASRARLAHAGDAERRRIERDLHDGAQQQLLALLARVELARTRLRAEDEGVDRELRAIGEGIRHVHRELRELARGIHPATLTDHGLGEAVRTALARLPLRTELVVSPHVESARYEQSIEGAAYFLVLEGLTNALKHGQITTARVSLTSRGDALEVVVSDPGRGFEPTVEGPGSGLVGLRDRLAAVGGRLEISSRPGAGTTLRGIFPAHGHVAC